MRNSIISSLKRLERVGSETSKATKKFKRSVEEVGQKIFKITSEFRKQEEVDNYQYTKIAKKLFLVEWLNSNSVKLCYDFDGKLGEDNCESYRIDSWPEREVCLHFSYAIAEGLLEEVAKWVSFKKIETDIAIEQLANAEIIV